MRGATSSGTLYFIVANFNPRTSCEVRPLCYPLRCQQQYFNPRTSCEVRRSGCLPESAGSCISIHAPLARCDRNQILDNFRLIISIHAPLARCDQYFRRRFLPFPDFNPRTSCEVRLVDRDGFAYIVDFNPRTSCEVRLLPPAVAASETLIFQSTHLLRGATSYRCTITAYINISIHAPLARCDRLGIREVSNRRYFNPRTSCEVRQPIPTWAPTAWKISIHAPLARCDRQVHLRQLLVTISIHAPLARCDQRTYLIDPLFTISIHAPLARCDQHAAFTGPVQADFNPRTSCEVRHLHNGTVGRCFIISIHAPLARCDRVFWHTLYSRSNFNPRTSCEVRLILKSNIADFAKFQSTHLLRGATRKIALLLAV